MERQKAEELLSLPGNRVGSFLVRESAIEKGEHIWLHKCLQSDLLVCLNCSFLLRQECQVSAREMKCLTKSKTVPEIN